MAHCFCLNGLQFGMIFPLFYLENSYLSLKTQVENQVCMVNMIPALKEFHSKQEYSHVFP